MGSLSPFLRLTSLPVEAWVVPSTVISSDLLHTKDGERPSIDEDGGEVGNNTGVQ